MDLTESLIASEYSVIRKIGEGRFSEVYLVTNIKDQKLYALKFHNLEQVKDKNEREQLKNLLNKRVSLMKASNHENVLKCYHVYQNWRYFAYVVDYCPDGSLLENVLANQVETDSILKILKQLICGLLSIISLGVRINSVNPSKILKKNHLYIICDFDLHKYKKSTSIKKDDQSLSKLFYCDEDGGNLKEFVWIVGGLYFFMLCKLKNVPEFYFSSEMRSLYSDQLVKNLLLFSIDRDSSDFLQCTLKFNERQRISFDQMLYHILLKKQCGFTATLLKNPSFQDIKHMKKQCSVIQQIDIQDDIQDFALISLTRSDAMIYEQKIQRDEEKLFSKIEELNFEIFKVEYIFKNLVKPLSVQSGLDYKKRKNVEFLYLISSQLFKKISQINSDLQKQELQICENILTELKPLFSELLSFFQQKGKELERIENKMSSKVHDFFFRSQDKQKERFFNGFEKLDYEKEEYQKFLQKNYLSLIKVELNKVKKMKTVSAILENYLALMKSKKDQFNQFKEMITFNE